MAKKRDENQTHLKVVTRIDESEDAEKVDPVTGQVGMFGTITELVPSIPSLSPEFAQFAGFFNARLAATETRLEESTKQTSRLANSLETVIPKFLDQSVNNTAPDLRIGELAKGQESDVAIADGTNVVAEALYTLTTGDLVDKVGNERLSPGFMGAILRALNIYGDPKFHYESRNGRASTCNKYKPQVVDEIYRRINAPDDYGLDLVKVAKATNKIRPKGAVS